MPQRKETTITGLLLVVNASHINDTKRNTLHTHTHTHTHTHRVETPGKELIARAEKWRIDKLGTGKEQL